MHQSHYLKRLLASLGERDVGKSAIEAQGLLAACWEQAVGKGASLALWEPGWIWQTVGALILGSDLTGWRQKPCW